MQDLATIAPAFVEMAHRIVWASVATVDRSGRPRSRVLHPIWTWEDGVLTGWVGTGPTPAKRAHLAHSPYASVNYWAPGHDTCVAECAAEWADDVETRTRVWNLLKSAPEPLGYDPGGIGVPDWQTPESPGFTALKLTPWRLRVMPGTLMAGKGGDILTWQRTE